MPPFPTYLQLESMDCGPTCLRIVAEHYGKRWSLPTLRERCHITNAGVSMLGISDAAESIGFRTGGVKIPWRQLRDDVPLPCIVHWNQNHFVVVYDIKRKGGKYKVYVSDLAAVLLGYDEEHFFRSWLSTEGGWMRWEFTDVKDRARIPKITQQFATIIHHLALCIHRGNNR